jgi:hypothetical protein
MATEANTEAAAQWYYLDGEQTCGPIPTQSVQQLLAEGRVSPSTYAFQEGMNDWAKMRDIAEFKASPPPLPRLMPSVEEVRADAERQNTTAKERFLWPTPITGTAALVFSILVGFGWAWPVFQVGVIAACFVFVATFLACIIGRRVFLRLNQKPTRTLPPTSAEFRNERIIAFGNTAAIGIGIFLICGLLLPVLWNAGVKAKRARDFAALEKRQAEDPVMREKTIATWREIQQLEAKLLRENGGQSFAYSQRASAYAQINTDRADPILVEHVAQWVAVARDTALVFGQVEREVADSRSGAKSFEEFLTVAGTFLGALANNNRSIQQNASDGAVAGHLAGKITGAVGTSIADDNIKQKYGQELSRCASNLELMVKNRAILAQRLSNKYGVQLLNAF